MEIGINEADRANSPLPQPRLATGSHAITSWRSCRNRSLGESVGGRHSCASTRSGFRLRITLDQWPHRFWLPARRKLYVTMRIDSDFGTDTEFRGHYADQT